MSTLHALADLAETSTSVMSKSGWETAGPYVASVVALFASLMSLVVAKGNRVATRRQERAAYRMRQLAEFYEPVLMLRMTTRELRRSLPSTESDGSRWRLVNHLRDVRQDAGMRAVTEAIIALNAQVEQAIVEKAALLEGDRPTSLDRFMRHSNLLKIAWSLTGKGDADVGVENVPFPDEIDDELESGRQAVKAALAELVSE